jgi:hypothetical protein
METSDSAELKTKRRFVRPLFVAAMVFLIGSFALFVVHQLFAAKTHKAIAAATTLKQLGVVVFSPEYKLAVLLGKLSDASGVVAVLLFLASFLAWARNRYLLGRNRVSK